jgi:SRSO17 transposase
MTVGGRGRHGRGRPCGGESARALVGARIYVPAGQITDPDRRAALDIARTPFRTKPQLAVDIMADMVADATMPGWCTGEEFYGRSGELRRFRQDHGIGYVLRVGRAFQTNLAVGVRMRADTVAATILSTKDNRRRRRDGREDGWQTCAVTRSKGDRSYAWA